MLAYRHAFHAGNHADVLKHLVLAQVLRHMGQKDKPYTLIDTHAGAGGYSLASPEAQKKGEFEHGILRLWDRTDLPAPVADYVALVRAFNPSGGLGRYPGSPEIARQLLRQQDRLRLFELHPTDVRILAAHHGERSHTEVHHADGFGLAGSGVFVINPPWTLRAALAEALPYLTAALAQYPGANHLLEERAA
jgi:23S rRNA (adenine2030-N6)-methyltransferase